MNLLAADHHVLKIDEPGIGAHLGVPISGLNGMRALNVPPERARINDFREEAGDYFFASRYQPVWQPLLRELILGRFEAQVRDSDIDESRAVVVIKEPHGSLAADLLMSTLPRSRMLFLLRDGRDVVDSELDATARGSWGSAQLEGFETSDVYRSAFIRERAHAWLWKTAIVDRVFHAHPAELRRMVRYEDLVADPEPILTDLVAWLDLQLGADEIAETAQRLSFKALPPESRGSGTFARAASPGL